MPIISDFPGGGLNTRDLPPQVKNLILAGGDSKIDATVERIHPDYEHLARFYRVIAKPGGLPASPTDGVWVDVNVADLPEQVLVPPVLADASWAQIDFASRTGLAKTLWSVGDEKDITLTTGEVLTMQIYDFDHDDLYDGSGKAGITFGMKHLMGAMRAMENGSTNSNIGGFTARALYAWMQNDLYNMLPPDLRPFVRMVNKKTSAGNRSTTIETNPMRIFPFSEIECFGAVKYSAAGEGVKYPIFVNTATRIKKLANGTGAVCGWWESSPDITSIISFCSIYPEGGANNSQTLYTLGVCFGFCV